jgi:hypothetical protein
LVGTFAWTALVAGLWPVMASGEDWKFDVLRLKNGKSFQGLLVEEGPVDIRFRCVRRNPGSPTVVISTTFQRSEIERIDKLDAKDRAVLEGRLKALDPTGKGEALRMEHLTLDSVPWIKPGNGDALRYASAYFVLVSNAREDIVRRAAVRLEQIYTAYARFLPARHQAGRPTRIYLFRSLTDYQALLKEQGTLILNPAFYDSRKNQILCASDLERLGDELERLRKKHQQILDKVKEKEASLNAFYKGKIPAARRKLLEGERQEVYQANLKNDAVFREATQLLFQTLYHEAFHAYLANFVYPPEEASVPLWLNEGLAQIFETALVEAGELRVGHADPDRLARLKKQAREGAVLPVTELLKAGSNKFLVNPTSDQQVSDRYYLHSWALSFYLTFDRHLLGTPALDRYVRSLKRGTDPVAAFRQLVGQPVPELERGFHQYLGKLRPDGSTAQTP